MSFFNPQVHHFDIQLVRDVCATYRKRRLEGGMHHEWMADAIDVYMAAHPELTNDRQGRLEASQAVMRMIYWCYAEHPDWMNARPKSGDGPGDAKDDSG